MITHKHGIPYFNGIMVRGATRDVLDRIVGCDKISGKNHVWHLRCETKDCKGIVIYRPSQRARDDHHLCQSCRLPDLGTTVDRVIDGVLHTRTVVGANKSGVTGESLYLVNCPGHGDDGKCDRTFYRELFLGVKKQPFCGPCFRRYRTRHGLVIQSNFIWQYRDVLLGPPRSYDQVRKNGTKGIRVFWHVKCSTPNCNEQVVLGADRTLRWQRENKLKPYEMIHRSHLRATEQRVKRAPHHPGTKLYDFEEYKRVIEACGECCHYCGTNVGRNVNGDPSVVASDRNEYSVASFLDRLHNDKPYQAGNVVTCCEGCNALKSFTLTEDETLLLVALRENDEQRSLRFYEKLADESYDFPRPRGWMDQKLVMRKRKRK
jgi:hypothetical protein